MWSARSAARTYDIDTGPAAATMGGRQHARTDRDVTTGGGLVMVTGRAAGPGRRAR